MRDGVKQADMAVVADEGQGRPDDFAGRLAEIDGGDDVAEPFHGGLSCVGSRAGSVPGRRPVPQARNT